MKIMKFDINTIVQTGSRTEYKRKFSLSEMYHSFTTIPGAMVELIKNKKKQLVNHHFIERLQLAVTEVNGCAACSYAHTYIALKQGMSNEEIQSFLNNDGKFIKPEEAKAIAFVQHFADTRMFPKKDVYRYISAEYGEEKAKIILSVAQLMTVGNIYGIPYSAFISRLKGKPYQDSSLVYELGMQIMGVFFLPVALVQGLLRTILGLPNFKLDESAG